MAPELREISKSEPTDQAIPLLCAGDRLTRDEFERRYQATPDVKKAELIEGVVYMPSPVSTKNHGDPHAKLVTWLGNYCATTIGTQSADNSTVRLDWDNEPQPDAFLRILPECGGQTRDDGLYISGGPELVCEVTASTASYDLHDKKEAFRRNGVQEYVVWRVKDAAVDWFQLSGGEYLSLPPREDGVICSKVFPGLWLDTHALLAGDMKRVLAVVAEGTNSDEHSGFVKKLASYER